ncbi:MAG: SGNH/GDSL hydrolase family protein [Candidatus Hydrogenedentes bacterium]|nr:SGNH/GDSL hydrolase family protein [Candidatus Hydrogenedentota bacterium]
MNEPYKIKILKIFGNVFFIFLWAVAILFFSEICFRTVDFCLRKVNPLVKELGERAPWFHSGKDGESETKHAFEDQISPLEWEVNRAKFFLQLDEKDKQLFANFRGLTIYFKTEGSNGYKVIPVEDKSRFKEDELKKLPYEQLPQLSGADGLYCPSYQLGDEVVYNLFGLRTSKFEVVWFKKIKTEEEKEDTPWKIPFFEYKSHYIIPGYEFRTNNCGCRDEDIKVPKPTNTYRIVAVGGSTTEEGPTSEQTYPNILERLLDENISDSCNVEVVNCGIPGITLSKIWIRLSDYLLLQPDLIILSEGVNDITHILLPYWLQNMGWLKGYLSLSDLMIWMFPEFFLPKDDKIEQDLINFSIDYIDKIADYLSQKNVVLVLTDMPAPSYKNMTLYERSYFQYVTKKWWGGRVVDYRMYEKVLNVYNDLLRGFSEDNKIPFISLSREFSEDQPSVFVDLCHMRLKGIKKKAEVVYSGVSEYLSNTCH